MNAELRDRVRGLQECALLCRPRNVVRFAVRYFHDEKSGDSSFAHALNGLPYLLRDAEAFRSAAATVYCSAKVGNSCDRKGLREVVKASISSVTGCPPSASPPPPPPPPPLPLSSSTSTTSRKQLETPSIQSSHFQQIALDEGDAVAVSWQIDVIDSALKEYLKALQRFDFASFVLTVRLCLSCWVVIIWVQDMAAEAGSFAELAASLKR